MVNFLKNVVLSRSIVWKKQFTGIFLDLVGWRGPSKNRSCKPFLIALILESFSFNLNHRLNISKSQFDWRYTLDITTKLVSNLWPLWQEGRACQIAGYFSRSLPFRVWKFKRQVCRKYETVCFVESLPYKFQENWLN